MKKPIILIAGRSGAGKSELAKLIAEEYGLKQVQSYTTRQPRKEELEKGLENSDHLFISDEEFDNLTDIVAQTTINGIRYCTTKDILLQSDLYVIDPNGIKYLREHIGREFHIVQFYIYADEEIRKQRHMQRGATASDFDAREAAESQQFVDYENNHGYDIIIYNNGDINDAKETFASYMKLVMRDRLKEIQKEKEKMAENTESEHEVEENLLKLDADSTSHVEEDKTLEDVGNTVPAESDKSSLKSNTDNILDDVESTASEESDEFSLDLDDEMFESQLEEGSELSTECENKGCKPGFLPSLVDADKPISHDECNVMDVVSTSNDLQNDGQPNYPEPECPQQSTHDDKPVCDTKTIDEFSLDDDTDDTITDNGNDECECMTRISDDETVTVNDNEDISDNLSGSLTIDSNDNIDDDNDDNDIDVILV